MENQLKSFILIFFYFTSYLCGENKPQSIDSRGSSSTRVKQTYRFDKLLDDGSYTISIENISGNIKLRGHEGSGAKLILTKIAHGVPENEIDEVHKLARAFITHFENEELILISGSDKNPYKGTAENVFELEFPKNINLNFQLLGGDIDIFNINGELILETQGGDISIESCEGRIETKTEGGDIQIINVHGVIRSHSYGGSLKASNSRGEIYLSSIGGNINLDQISGITDVQTTGGSITLFNVSGEKIDCRTSGGSIQGENLSGNITLNSSGSSIDVSTINGEVNLFTSGGSIVVNNLEGILKCEASSGNIEMTDIAGSVDCVTSAGDVSLELVYDSSTKDNNIHLETHAGDAFINIPEGLEGNINSTIYQADSEKDLNCEFPLQTEISDRTITGRGKIGGGTIPINIEVYNGSITIKQD